MGNFISVLFLLGSQRRNSHFGGCGKVPYKIGSSTSWSLFQLVGKLDPRNEYTSLGTKRIFPLSTIRSK